jgi:small subunit ribosomal protein S13
MIRILGNDIPGDKKMIVGLTQIKGIGYMFANTMLSVLKINSNQRIGHLTNDQILSIENVIKNPSSNFPSWFLNRRKDLETGEDQHLLTSDIAFAIRNDIEREKTTGSWRGYRHMYGLKVRGQRTRCTGRKGGAVGVAKGGKIMPAQTEGVAAGTPTEGTEGEQPTTESKEGTEKKAAAPKDEKKAAAPKDEKKAAAPKDEKKK